MKFQIRVLFLILIFMFGCSDENSDSTGEMTEAGKKGVMEAHERITREGILADFVNKISNSDFDKALLLLHPSLREAWAHSFANDWESIRKQLSSEWEPEATSSFSGNSPQGPYEQAAYRLSSDWRSLSSVDLVSVKKENQEHIVRVHVRVPYGDLPPKPVSNTVDQLTNLIINEKYKETEELMTPNCRKQFPEETIKKLRPVLGNDPAKIEKSYYRLCANTVWYDVVRLNYLGDGFTFIEFILSSDENTSKIVTLTFRGKIR